LVYPSSVNQQMDVNMPPSSVVGYLKGVEPAFPIPGELEPPKAGESEFYAPHEVLGDGFHVPQGQDDVFGLGDGVNPPFQLLRPPTGQRGLANGTIPDVAMVPERLGRLASNTLFEGLLRVAIPDGVGKVGSSSPVKALHHGISDG
jgi:hypothetical protein